MYRHAKFAFLQLTLNFELKEMNLVSDSSKNQQVLNKFLIINYNDELGKLLRVKNENHEARTTHKERMQ